MDRYWKGFLPEPSVRTVGDMECVLADRDGVELDSTTPLYYMYRDLAMNETDREVLSRQNIRYDITVIPPVVLGREYVKTKGHYHPDTSSGIGYPELYQVLAGEAHFLLQRKDLSDVVTVAASAGEYVLVPPGYGHVSINQGKEALVMANLVSNQFESEYAVYEEMHGGAYYAQKKKENGSGNVWTQNPVYLSASPIRALSARDTPELDVMHGMTIKHGMGIYNLVSESADLSFLNEPEKIMGVFA
ncbi:glucose-6-phosphate isomerase [Methanogenium marinum]|uniref:glucose-6-phosphate isomerase n=1 Tax=Methanogenium marinum TaxID=348610 RepID=A0A9Q4KRH0_9EURY|nr:glucose-6-phosphate isomerase family protein [Methanogenium marinum]MDE4907337.1 glucose-6-phosphate isomerase [Methanogenium marinum]